MANNLRSFFLFKFSSHPNSINKSNAEITTQSVHLKKSVVCQHFLWSAKRTDFWITNDYNPQLWAVADTFKPVEEQSHCVCTRPWQRRWYFLSFLAESAPDRLSPCLTSSDADFSVRVQAHPSQFFSQPLSWHAEKKKNWVGWRKCV